MAEIVRTVEECPYDGLRHEDLPFWEQTASGPHLRWALCPLAADPLALDEQGNVFAVDSGTAPRSLAEAARRLW